MIDTHAHINHNLFLDKEQDILEDLKNLEAIVCPSYDKQTCVSALEYAQKYKNVFGALAIHPSETQDWNEETKTLIASNLQNKKIVAVGEYGLDYHFLPFDKQKQQEVMLEQLELAKKAKMPSIFHVRDAFDDFVPMLKENLSGFQGGVVHCFDGTTQDAKKLLDLGLFISFTGIITFKKREELREIVKFVPLDRFMLETDSPYLAPEPLRGQICFPRYVKHIHELVAELKNTTFEHIEEINSKNAKNFFRKMEI